MYANIPVNQQLFATTLFPDEPAINWFAHVLLLPYGEYWSGARNIRDNEALANAAKISRIRIQAGVLYEKRKVHGSVVKCIRPVAQNSMIRVPL